MQSAKCASLTVGGELAGSHAEGGRRAGSLAGGFRGENRGIHPGSGAGAGGLRARERFTLLVAGRSVTLRSFAPLPPRVATALLAASGPNTSPPPRALLAANRRKARHRWHSSRPTDRTKATHSEIRLQIQFPKGSTLALPPKSEDLKDGNHYPRLRDSAEGDVLRLDRALDLPAGRVQLDEYAAFRQFTVSVDEMASRELVVTLP